MKFKQSDCKNIELTYNNYLNQIGTDESIAHLMLLIYLNFFCTHKISFSNDENIKHQNEKIFPLEEQKLLLEKIKSNFHNEKMYLKKIINPPKLSLFEIGLNDYELSLNEQNEYSKMLSEAIYFSFKPIYDHYKFVSDIDTRIPQINSIYFFENLNLIQPTISNENSIKIEKYLQLRTQSYPINKILLNILDVKANYDSLNTMEKLSQIENIINLIGKYLEPPAFMLDSSANSISTLLEKQLLNHNLNMKKIEKFNKLLNNFPLFFELNSNDLNLLKNGLFELTVDLKSLLISLEQEYLIYVIEDYYNNVENFKYKIILKNLVNKDIPELFETLKVIQKHPQEVEEKYAVDEILIYVKHMLTIKNYDKFKEVPSLQNELKIEKFNQLITMIEVSLYDELNNKLIKNLQYGEILQEAHQDFIVVLKACSYLNRETNIQLSKEEARKFMNIKAFEKINVLNGHGNEFIITMKNFINKYMEIEDFEDANTIKYRPFKENTETVLLNILSSINDEDNEENKKFLIEFIEKNQQNNPEINSLESEEYFNKIYNLNINPNERFKLLTYSVNWRKLKIKTEVEKYSMKLSIKKFYDLFLNGNEITKQDIKMIFDENSAIINEEQLIILANNIQKKIQKNYHEKISEKLQLLKMTNDPLVIKFQLLKLFNCINNLNNNNINGDNVKIKRLRNYLADEDLFNNKLELIENIKLLKNYIINEMEKIPIENLNFNKLEEIFVKFEENIAFLNAQEKIALKNIQSILCPAATDIFRRKKRETENCLTLDEINEIMDSEAYEEVSEGHLKNPPKINSAKFIQKIKKIFLNLEMNNDLERLENYLKLVSYSTITFSTDPQQKMDKLLIDKLIDKHKSFEYLNKMGKISGAIIQGQMYKNLISGILNDDLPVVAINLGFIGSSYALPKLANYAFIKGTKYIGEGKLFYGSSLKLVSPLLLRVTTGFIVYDLVNQIKAYKNGNPDALVPIIGDSVILTVDATEIGIEMAELVEFIEKISSVTAPIEMTIGAVVFIGVEIYSAVRKVEKIDEQIHLTGWEKFKEGWRAFLHMQEEQYIQDLLELKTKNNKLVDNAEKFLINNTNIRRYIFPNIYIKNYEKYRSFPNQNKKIDLRNKLTHIKLSRTTPNNPNNGKLICLNNDDDGEISTQSFYECENAFGYEYNLKRTGNYTLINLGDGRDIVYGSVDFPNIFLIGEDKKEIFGGKKNDLFIFQKKIKTIIYKGTYPKSYIDGDEGINTIDISQLFYINYKDNVILADLQQDYLTNRGELKYQIKNIHNFVGRKNASDVIYPNCNTKMINGNGGKNSNFSDNIYILDKCIYNMKIIVNPYTIIKNNASNGNFTYFITNYIINSINKTYLNNENSNNVEILLMPNQTSINHTIIFNFTLFDIENIYKINEFIIFNFFNKISNKYSYFNIKITAIQNNTIKYLLIDNTEILITKNKSYIIHNNHEPIDNYNNIVKYSNLAKKLESAMFIHSFETNSTIAIGSGDHEVLHNDPQYKTHLIGNGGENVFIIDSKYENFPEILEIFIYNFDNKTTIDTLDLRKTMEKNRYYLKEDEKYIKREIHQDKNNLIIKLLNYEYYSPRIFLNKMTLQINLIEGVKWYSKIQIILDKHTPMGIEKSNNIYCLESLPLIINVPNKSILIISPKDIIENKQIDILKVIGNYSFIRDNDNLLISNAFNLNTKKEDFFTLILKDFYYYNYYNAKKLIITLKFLDTKILINPDEIDETKNFINLKNQYKLDFYESNLKNKTN